MASFRSYVLLSLLLHSILLISKTVKCDGQEETLLRGINSYRATLSLTTLTENDKADCLAGELADQFKNQPCTNTTGSNTVPGTEPQFPNYPNLLDKCKLNLTTTRDGAVMPACVPKLDSNLLLSNYTQTQYAGFLNDTKYTGAGIGYKDDWVVVILTTNTSEGNYSTGTNFGMSGTNSPDLLSKLSLTFHMVVLVSGFLLLF